MRATNKMVVPAIVAVMAVAGCANSSSGGSGSSSGGAGDGIKNLPVQSKIEIPSDAAKAAGKGGATCAANTTIAYIGAETGDNAQLGINIYNGVQLAINEHNKANPKCQVKFSKYDTEGDPTKATGPVNTVVKDQNVIGVVGLPFSSESKATGGIFQSAGLVHITPSATNPGLTKNGWTTFFRGLGNDNVQGPAVARLATKLGAKKVFVIGDDSDYGKGLFATSEAGLKKAGLFVGDDHTVTKQTDFSTTAQNVIASKADAVFYAGYYNEGSPLDQQLVQKGFKGVFIGPDGVKDDQFIKLAGSASSNAYFTCPCIPGELIPSFASAYEGVSGGKAPGTYSVEGYDATTILLAGIDAGKTTRPALLDFVKNYDADGLSKKYKWDSTGELSDLSTYGYKVQDGKIVSIGKI